MAEIGLSSAGAAVSATNPGVARRALSRRIVPEDCLLPDLSNAVDRVEAAESVVSFRWRDLRFHVVTREPLCAQELHTIEGLARKVTSVGMFADALAMVTGRSVRIRTERPSPDVRFEVGL